MTPIAPTCRRAARQIASHPQSDRLRKLLFALQYQQWPPQPPEMNEAQLEQILGAIVQQTQTLKGLATQLNFIVSKLNKASVYQKVAAILQQILSPLYSQSTPVTLTKLELSMATLYDLRLEVTRYCTPLHVKLLLAALLTQKPVHAQGLERFTLIDLLQRVVGHFSDIETLRARVQQTLKRFDNDVAYANAGDRLIKVLYPLYSRSQPTVAVDVTPESTPTSLGQDGSDDGDELTCQLFA
ncbi:hypothetical protein [Parathermosynechococcus lividus]|nr:hypothetical protein [Synechococcus sp. PCC 6716]